MPAVAAVEDSEEVAEAPVAVEQVPPLVVRLQQLSAPSS